MSKLGPAHIQVNEHSNGTVSFSCRWCFATVGPFGSPPKDGFSVELVHTAECPYIEANDLNRKLYSQKHDH